MYPASGSVHIIHQGHDLAETPSSEQNEGLLPTDVAPCQDRHLGRSHPRLLLCNIMNLLTTTCFSVTLVILITH